ncbi:heterokaryon incompatibility protein-domain-containing protein [Boeremia exigua]|uniref:heterokaryon incompatibility protein-domain-containing protein n=1 Tax=Boeremia exigua TaxID=749465 RepID=UPI001E8E6320|nr:heterokaryon incompatibility protein-domain-containing protein [Boeremia exigua]KAH6644550.1 heterokaryon incompatibility protein-domain-containing protein [Boeremia exigua]
MTDLAVSQSIYHDLDIEKKAFRLLRIEPALHHVDPIRCELSAEYLDSDVSEHTPHYEALSYVWGLDIHHTPIQVAGRPMRVTANLYEALLHLRHVSDDRVVWIDALCINQEDLLERKYQVALMRRIYQKASSTIVWLGVCPSNDCELAMRYLAQLGQDDQLHLLDTLTPHARVDGHHASSPNIQNGLKSFLANTWWSRMWTVQEWILSQKVIFQYGPHLLCGQLARQAIHNWRMHFHHLPCCLQLHKSDVEVGYLHNLFFGFDAMDYIRLLMHDVSLPYVISQFRATRRATNPRDMVYGVLGLANNQYQDIVVADYFASTEEAFESSTLAMIKQTGSLDVLSHLPLDGERNLVLPSYVPDWTVPSEDLTYSDWLNWLSHLHLYNACSSEVAHLVSVSPGSICLKGLVVDSVHSLASVPSRLSRAAYMKEVLGLAGVEFSRKRSTTDNERVMLFWAAMCGTMELYIDQNRGDRPFYRRIPAPTTTDCSSFERWAAWELELLDGPAPRNDAEIRSVFLPHRVLRGGRRFAVTKKGRLAWCPNTCQVGDAISVLAGGTVPIVLRECGNKTYQVVGDAYVHGIMDGEAIEDMRTAGEQWADIVLV